MPIYRWIGAGERLQRSHAIFLAKILDAYRGVADVRTGNGRIVIEERETGKTISIPSSPPW